MEPAQGLLTFAEIAVAFAGFSSLVVLFRRDASGRWRRIDALAFRDMIGISLVAAAFSVFPFLVLQFSPQPAMVWGSLSALLALCMLGAILILAPSVLRAVTSRSEGAIAVSGFAGTAVGKRGSVPVGKDIPGIISH